MSNDNFNENATVSLPFELALDALTKAKRMQQCVEPYLCTVPTCGRPTDNPPFRGACRTCTEAGNYSPEPFWVVSRIMGWAGNTPSDLIETMTSVKNPETGRYYSVDDFIAIAHDPEKDAKQFYCDLWDEATKYPVNQVGMQRVQNEDTRYSKAEPGASWVDTLVAVPEEHWEYKSRPRPKSTRELEEQAENAAKSQELDKERIREASVRAAIRQLEKAQRDAKALGIVTETF